MDTSSQHDQIMEGEAIKMATSHLEHVDTPSKMQGTPMLQTSLTVSVDISAERVELTLVVPSIKVMTGVVAELSGGSSPR